MKKGNPYGEIQKLIETYKGDFEKFYEGGNKTAGTRVRKMLQELKVLAQKIRTEIQDIKNSDTKYE